MIQYIFVIELPLYVKMQYLQLFLKYHYKTGSDKSNIMSVFVEH